MVPEFSGLGRLLEMLQSAFCAFGWFVFRIRSGLSRQEVLLCVRQASARRFHFRDTVGRLRVQGINDLYELGSHVSFLWVLHER